MTSLIFLLFRPQNNYGGKVGGKCGWKVGGRHEGGGRKLDQGFSEAKVKNSKETKLENSRDGGTKGKWGRGKQKRRKFVERPAC